MNIILRDFNTPLAGLVPFVYIIPARSKGGRVKVVLARDAGLPVLAWVISAVVSFMVSFIAQLVVVSVEAACGGQN